LPTSFREEAIMGIRRSAPEKWQFQTRFRRGALGWRASAAGVKRLGEAVTEICRVARHDPIRAAEGAILLFGRISPAFEHVDSSSGSLGSAVNRTIDRLVSIVAAAPVDDALRAVWLERLWTAFSDDGMGYLDEIGDSWGDLCANPITASAWADRLLPVLTTCFLAPRGTGGYFHGTTACLSALLKAGRHSDLEVLERAPFVWWAQRSYGFAALVAQGQRAEALRYAEASRESTGNADIAIARACEELLLQSGMADEAYARYAITASADESTYLARFRSLTKRYSSKAPSVLLTDLVASTPGDDGKWFAAAKWAGLFDVAIELANRGPTDPKTLARAARDYLDEQPAFAMESSLAALRWFGAGYGFDVIALDIMKAYDYGWSAAERLGETDAFIARVRATIAAAGGFVRDSLRSRIAI